MFMVFCQQNSKIRFANGAPPICVTASEVNERHQIDLIDMQSIACDYHGTTYKYVLSIIDVFSRCDFFCWCQHFCQHNFLQFFEIYKKITHFEDLKKIEPQILWSWKCTCLYITMITIMSIHFFLDKYTFFCLCQHFFQNTNLLRKNCTFLPLLAWKRAFFAKKV